MLLSAGDQRMYVSFGPWKKNNIALSQTFPGFNSVYEGTVEWRIAKAADKAADGKAGPSPPSCAGTWSRLTIARRRPARSRAPDGCWS